MDVRGNPLCPASDEPSFSAEEDTFVRECLAASLPRLKQLNGAPACTVLPLVEGLLGHRLLLHADGTLHYSSFSTCGGPVLIVTEAELEGRLAIRRPSADVVAQEMSQHE